MTRIGYSPSGSLSKKVVHLWKFLVEGRCSIENGTAPGMRYAEEWRDILVSFQPDTWAFRAPDRVFTR
jgi:hypothetical protein